MMKAPQPPGAPSPHVSHTHCDRHGHHNLSGARIDRQEAQLARFCIPRCAAVTRADNAALRDRERGTRWKIGREGLLRFRIAPVHHCGTPTEVSQRPSQAGSESSGTGGPRNGLSGQNLTSGANSPDPAQDSQASDQKGLPVPGRPFSLLARRGVTGVSAKCAGNEQRARNSDHRRGNMHASTWSDAVSHGWHTVP